MAAEDQAVKAVDVDGVIVKIDTDYQKSWDGIEQATRMRKLASDEGVSNDEKFIAVFDYYTSVVANIDEIKEAMGGNPPAQDVFDVIKAAIAEAGESKN